jgi:hypothetical protein
MQEASTPGRGNPRCRRVGNRGPEIAWILVVLLALPAAVQAQAVTSLQVDRLQVMITVLDDQRIRVEEKLAFDLGSERRRTIDRRIRLAPLVPGRPRLDVHLLAVTDDAGAPWPIRTWQWGDELEIRIGSGESFLTGRQSVILVYVVDGAITRGRARDALAWDVTGGPWEVPVIEAQATVVVPEGATPEAIDAGSEIGRPGEVIRHADFKTIDQQQVRFALLRGVGMRETCRVFVSWPAPLASGPRMDVRFARWLITRPWWALPIAVLLGGLGAAFLRRRAARRAQAPGMLTPAELAYLLDGEITGEALLGTTLDLARRGHLAIRPATGGYGLIAHPPATDAVGPGDALKAHETQWLQALAASERGGGGEIGGAELEWRAFGMLPVIAPAVVSELIAAGFLRRPGWPLRRTAIGLGLALGASFFLALLAGARFPAGWPGLLSASILAALLGLLMITQRTSRGDAARAWARTFRSGRIGSKTKDSAVALLVPIAIALGAGARWMTGSAGPKARPSYWPPLAETGDRFDPPAILRELRLLAAPFRAAGESSPRLSARARGE